MKRTLIALSLVASLIASAALGFAGGRMVAHSESEMSQLVESVRVNDLVTADLASTDAVSREAALWYKAASLQYGTDPPFLKLGEPGRSRELMLAYARIAEHSTTHQHADRTQLLLARSEEVCNRTKLDPCARAEIMGFLKRLSQPATLPTK